MKISSGIIIICSLFFLACNNDKGAVEPVEAGDSTDVLSGVFSWHATLNDSTGKMEMIKQDFTGPDTLSARGVTEFLNITNPNIQLAFSRISNDTIFVLIPDALYLTQQMGSSGPPVFFASAVYNYTEIPGIKYVSFDFEEGDHASPAVLSRDSFANQ